MKLFRIGEGGGRGEVGECLITQKVPLTCLSFQVQVTTFGQPETIITV